MTFGEKLKKLRSDNGITQEELADKIFVTRSAISKWETDKGYPSIDSLKALANLFNVSIDELISDADVENKKLLDDKIARRMYYIAISFLGVTILFTLLSFFLKIHYFGYISIATSVCYIVFALLSKPKYKRLQARKLIVPYVVSRIVILVVVIGVIVSSILIK